MSDKPSDKTIITLVLPAAETDAQATISIQQRDLGHLSAFDHSDFATLCRALNNALAAFVGVQADPPQDIKPAKAASTGKKETQPKQTDQPKPAGKPPYHLLDASGKRRKVTMIDPFELQMKYQRNNPKLSFDALGEAVAVACQLVEAGDKQISVVYSNGEPVKVLPEAESGPKNGALANTLIADNAGDDPTEILATDASPDDLENAANCAADEAADAVRQVEPGQNNPDSGDADAEIAPIASDVAKTEAVAVEAAALQERAASTYPTSLDSAAKRAFYDVLGDARLTLHIFEDIQTLRQHGWKSHLIKQRQVKGLIAAHLDDKHETIEQIYQIAYASAEFNDVAESATSNSQ